MKKLMYVNRIMDICENAEKDMEPAKQKIFRTREEYLAEVNSGTKHLYCPVFFGDFSDTDFSTVHMIQPSFEGSFRNCVFQGQDLQHARFEGNFDGSNFSDCDLQCASFSNRYGEEHVSLRNVDFAYSVLIGCKFDHADLTSATFEGANVMRVKFDNCVSVDLTKSIALDRAVAAKRN